MRNAKAWWAAGGLLWVMSIVLMGAFAEPPVKHAVTAADRVQALRACLAQVQQ